MAGFSVTEAAASGVRLLTRKPLAAAAWGLIYAAFLAVILVPFAGALVGIFATLAKPGASPAPEAVLALFGGVAGLVLLFAIGALVIGAVISCAVFRAVLHPENSSFFYLRLGSEELWVMLVSFVRGLFLGVIQLVLAIPMGILIAIFAAKAPGVALGVRLIGQLVIDGVGIWITLRLSLSGPMTFAERKFRLFESWTLTRGLGWRLLGVGVLIGLMALAVYILVLGVGLVAGVTIWDAAPHPANLQAFLSLPPAQWMRGLAPLLTLIAVLIGVAGAVLTPILLAPWVHIYRRLNPEADIASTFA